MISIKEFMELVNYRITEGSEYLWECYGYNAFCLDSSDAEYNISIVFDKASQEVYELTAIDYQNNRAYRLFNPNYKDAYQKEAIEKKVAPGEAWEGVTYIDLEVNEDFLEKAQAIINSEDYDDRVIIPLDVTDEEALALMKAAHMRDITLNQFVAEAIQSALDHDSQQQKELGK